MPGVGDILVAARSAAVRVASPVGARGVSPDGAGAAPRPSRRRVVSGARGPALRRLTTAGVRPIAWAGGERSAQPGAPNPHHLGHPGGDCSSLVSEGRDLTLPRLTSERALRRGAGRPAARPPASRSRLTTSRAGVGDLEPLRWAGLLLLRCAGRRSRPRRGSGRPDPTSRRSPSASRRSSRPRLISVSAATFSSSRRSCASETSRTVEGAPAARREGRRDARHTAMSPLADWTNRDDGFR